MAVNTFINALQPANISGAFLAGQQQGRQMAQQRATDEALKSYQTDPQGAINALVASGNVQGANQLSQFDEGQRSRAVQAQVSPMIGAGDYAGAAKTAAGAGRFDLAANIGKLDEAQRAKAAKLADTLASASFTLKQLPPEQRQAALEQMKPQLVAQGIPEASIGTQPLTDEYLDASIAQGMGLKEKLAQANTDRTFTATREDSAQRQADRIADNERADRAQKERERADAARERRLLTAVSGAGGGGPLWVQKQTPDGMTYLENQRTGDRKADPSAKGQQPDRKTEMDLRKEFDAQPEVKNFRTVATAARQVQALASSPPSANNDIALIYSVMKAYDPTSVVRETEFATAQFAASVPDRWRNQYNRVVSGQRLNPQQRAEMAKAVATVARASGDRFATVADNYRSYAQQAGANPDHIVKYERKPTGGGPAKSAAPAAKPASVKRPPLDSIFGQ